MNAAHRRLHWTILTLLLATTARAEMDSKVYELYKQGKAAFEKRDYDAAVTACDQALRLNPKHFAGYMGRAHAYRMKRDFKRAIADYGEAIQLLSEDPRTYDERGFVGTLRDFENALSFRRLLAETYLSRADIYVQKHDYDQAIADLTQAISLEPRDGRFYSNRALVHVARKDFVRAIADCDRLILLAPNEADSYVFRGSLYMKMEDYEPALTDLNEAVQRNSQFIPAYFYRGMLHLSRKEYARAITDLEKTVHLDPGHSRACFALANLFADCPQADLRDRQKALHYARKGCGVAEREYEIAARSFAVPIQYNRGQRETLRKLRVFVSEDQGKSWSHYKEYTPSDCQIIFTASHDGRYWFAIQEVLKDGGNVPAKIDDLIPAMKVHVSAEASEVEAQKSPEEREREVEQLRRTLEDIQKKIAQLESEDKPK